MGQSLVKKLEREIQNDGYVEKVIRFFNSLPNNKKEEGERNIVYLDKERVKWISRYDQRVVDRQGRY